MTENSVKVIFASLFLLSFDANGQDWFQNGEPSANNEWRQSKNGLGVMQLLSTDPSAFLENWDKPTDGVAMSTSNEVVRGKPIVSFVLFSGCKVNVKGMCNLSIVFDVRSPSGAVYTKSDPMDMWFDKPAPTNGALQLSVNYLGIVIEPKDELGEYTIFAEITDHNSDAKILTTQKFIALE